LGLALTGTLTLRLALTGTLILGLTLALTLTLTLALTLALTLTWALTLIRSVDVCDVVLRLVMRVMVQRRGSQVARGGAVLERLNGEAAPLRDGRAHDGSS
jgi:hypothetical protein